MIDTHARKVPLRRQCLLLGLAPSTAYYRPKGSEGRDAVLRNRIDEIYTAHPFFGSRQIRNVLRREGMQVGRRVRRLMRLMGLEAQCRSQTCRSLPRGTKWHILYLDGD